MAVITITLETDPSEPLDLATVQAALAEIGSDIAEDPTDGSRTNGNGDCDWDIEIEGAR